MHAFALHRNDTHKATKVWGVGVFNFAREWTDRAKQTEFSLSLIGVWCHIEMQVKGLR